MMLYEQDLQKMKKAELISLIGALESDKCEAESKLAEKQKACDNWKELNRRRIEIISECMIMIGSFLDLKIPQRTEELYCRSCGRGYPQDDAEISEELRLLQMLIKKLDEAKTGHKKIKTRFAY